jgi:hypothetical protein
MVVHTALPNVIMFKAKSVSFIIAGRGMTTVKHKHSMIKATMERENAEC